MFSIKSKSQTGKPGSPDYEAKKKRAAEVSASDSRKGRDIAPLPPVVNPERKAQGRESLEFFCRTYFPQTFSLPWSLEHREIIATIERAAREGGLHAYAMPRGSGKTSVAEAATIWATLHGFRLYPFVVGSDEGAAGSILQSIKTELEQNDLLLEDFPEVCYPIRRLEGIAHRCNGQLFEGKRTFIHWTANEIVLPTIPGSAASGAVIRVTGIEGGFRGARFKRPDGKSVRPDLLVIDDPQTDQSAKSPSQCVERVRILCGAMLGLGGPGKKIAAVMPCTVIRPGDMADEILDRDRHPEWQGKRTKMVNRFPDDMEKWEEYRQVRAAGFKAGDRGKAANDHYRANREAMDKGGEVSWPARKNPDDVSAIQHAMNLRFDVKDPAFFAEYQNEPLAEQGEVIDALTAAQIAAKVNKRDRGDVPAEVTRLTAFVDVQQNVLYWAVCGFEDDFTGYVLDYGTFPDQRRAHFRLNDVRRTLKKVLGVNGLEESLYVGLQQLSTLLLNRQWEKDDGTTLQIERKFIDTGWAASRDVIYKFCRETTYGNIVRPSRGIGIGATGRSFNEHKLKRGERKGLHWRETLTTDKPIQRRLYIDTNFWKSFVHERLAIAIGGRGCLSLFGSVPDDHRLFSEHLTSEQPVPVSAKGQTVTEWKQSPSKPDNHWFDCIVGCHAAAAERGASLAEHKQKPRKRRGKVRLSELEKNGTW